MTDRELLEMAAKAAGINHHHIDDDGVWWRNSHMSESVYKWNPLADDGDALRLAVKLNLIIGPFATYVSVAETYDKPKLGAQGREFVCWHHETKGDQLAATRRAIVRAAAEIGRPTP